MYFLGVFLFGVQEKSSTLVVGDKYLLFLPAPKIGAVLLNSPINFVQGIFIAMQGFTIHTKLQIDYRLFF